MSQFLPYPPSDFEHLTPKEYIAGYLTPLLCPIWGTCAELEYICYQAFEGDCKKNEGWWGILLGCVLLPFLFHLSCFSHSFALLYTTIWEKEAKERTVHLKTAWSSCVIYQIKWKESLCPRLSPEGVQGLVWRSLNRLSHVFWPTERPLTLKGRELSCVWDWSLIFCFRLWFVPIIAGNRFTEGKQEKRRR